MKILLIIKCFILLVLIGCTSEKQRAPSNLNSNIQFQNIFDNVKYDSVIAYNYNGEAGREIIDDSGTLSPKINKRILLKNDQIKYISNSLCNPSTYGGSMAACFDPHLGIVFYSANKPKAFVSICLDCNSLISSIKIKAANSGFSDSGNFRIRKFQKEIGY